MELEKKDTYNSDDGGIELNIDEATELGGFTDDVFGVGESELVG